MTPPDSENHSVMDPLNVLLVGDGNFSFSLALCRQVWPRRRASKRPSLAVNLPHSDDHHDHHRSRHQHSNDHHRDDVSIDSYASSIGTTASAGYDAPDPNSAGMRLLGDGAEARTVHITATSFDTEEEVITKYPESVPILARLHRYKNVTVLHRINAWTLPEHFPTQKFDIVIWNHPHLGLEDFRLHRLLLAHFLHSATAVLKPDVGVVCVSVVNGQDVRWNLKGQAARAGLELVSVTPFVAAEYPGYICKRNKNGQSFKNLHTLEHHGHDMWSATYRFGFPRGDSDKVALDLAALYLPETSFANAARKDVERPFQCQECGKRFTCERGVKVHTRQVHELKKYGEWEPDRPRQLPCSHCNEVFATDADLWQHQVSRHKFDAEIPGRPSHDIVGLDERKSEEVEESDCHICGARVPAGWGMEAHLESLKPVAGLDVHCNMCGEAFIEYRALRQHLNYCRVGVDEKRAVLGTQLASGQ